MSGKTTFDLEKGLKEIQSGKPFTGKDLDMLESK